MLSRWSHCVFKVSAVWCTLCACRVWVGCRLNYELRDAGIFMGQLRVGMKMNSVWTGIGMGLAKRKTLQWLWESKTYSCRPIVWTTGRWCACVNSFMCVNKSVLSARVHRIIHHAENSYIARHLLNSTITARLHLVNKQFRVEMKWNCNDFECVRKPTGSRLSLTHCTNKSSRWVE